MIPAEPRLDLPFISLIICSLILFLIVIYYGHKARIYKERLDALEEQNQNKDHPLTNIHNCIGGEAKANNKFQGEG